jgi:V/A-type H+/Na+-transporting ATPase subunit D
MRCGREIPGELKNGMEQVRPTRMELMKKKAQIRLAEQGRDLLREKMDALIREFFKILSTVSESRDELEKVSRAADLALMIAEAVDDPVTLRSASFATRRSITVDITGKNIMGVPVPVIEKKRVSKNMLERGYGIIATSARIDETAERYEVELDLLIKLAEIETAMRRLGTEIQMNRRRVNALEQVLIPELKGQAKYIKNAIEEREREDLFRLKKVKSIIERKKRKAREKKKGL